MSRALLWVMLYLLSLGTLSIRVRYTDGLEINLVGWPDALMNRRKHKSARAALAPRQTTGDQHG